MKVNTDRKKSIQKNLTAYSFIAPNFIGFAIFTMFPIIYAIGLGFCKWDGSNPPEFVGLSNFIYLFKDTFFKSALINTIFYALGTVPLTIAMSLGLAMLLNKNIRGRGVVRTIACIPYIGSIIAVTAVWRMIFHPSKGPVNTILYFVFNVARDNLPQWFSGHLIIFSYILFSVWKFMGYYMVIYLAGLQGISKEFYEAGTIDGANSWQQFRFITWPQLHPTTFFVIIIMTINCFKIYDIAVLLSGSNILSTSSMVLVSYIYTKAFGSWELGVASSAALILFLSVLAITIFQFKNESKYSNN